MQRYSLFGAIALCAAVSLSSAQGGAAIITLARPPAGEGYAALQSGVALPAGAASAWYNPALLSELERSTGSSLHAARSKEDWFIPGASLDFSVAAATLPVLGTDVGIALYRAEFDFGGYPPFDTTSDQESVLGIASGIRINEYLSTGFSVKHYRSEIGVGKADGFAFDLGLGSLHRFLPVESAPSLEIAPSVGTVLQNMGPDVSYAGGTGSDPLPLTWRTGAGLDVDFAELVRLTAGHDWEKAVHRRASWSDPAQRTFGVSASVFGFRYGIGWLKDPGGNRDERSEAREYEFNLKRIQSAVHRFRAGDFTTASEALKVGSLFGARAGLLRDLNPRFVIGKREIVSGNREGQDAWYFSVAL